MKLILLINATKNDFENLLKKINIKNIALYDSSSIEEDKEYSYLKNEIDYFSKSSNEIMLIRYSGKKAISQEIGDECSEMIIPIALNGKTENHYPCQSINNVNELINIFKKEI